MTTTSDKGGTPESREQIAEDSLKHPGNRLAGETSPYLLQHAGNPVNWHPWDDKALDLARSEHKPIFLSIGYSACHWCHVMERESFENEDIAALLNQDFLCIKVDREERPDLDELYMNAVVTMTGNGGWPMSVFLTPDLKPFYGGTYFPPFSRHGIVGFSELLIRIAQIWKESPAEVVKSAEEITRHLRLRLAPPVGVETRLTPEIRENAVNQLQSIYDSAWGGWGNAPKFPSSASISLLLRQFRRNGNSHLIEMVENTLRRMALGGIYDHLGGGFHRYSVDDKWIVPHFEKMLYDNALLACAYLEAWQVSKNSLYKGVACETLHYLLREMQGDHGGFFSSEDADSGGEEGQYYLWTRAEILRCLGNDDGTVFCQAYSIREEGNFASNESCHRGKNIIYRDSRADPIPVETEQRLSIFRDRLLEERCFRTRPGKDDKVITAWNALAISALAKAAFAWDMPEFEAAACKAGLFLKEQLFKNGTLHRTWRCGVARFPGYLDDYAFTTNAFIDLYECTGDFAWLSTARTFAEMMLDHFSDNERGGFYSSATSHSHLITRIKPLHDTAEPSPNAMAAMALARLGCFFDLPRFVQHAMKALLATAPLASRAPLGYLNSILAGDFLLDTPVEVVFVGPKDSSDILAMKHVLASSFLPCRVIAWSQTVEDPRRIPLCASKSALGTKATVYVCVNYTCLPPVFTPEDFARLLKNLQN